MPRGYICVWKCTTTTAVRGALTQLHHRARTGLLDLPLWTLSSLGLISRRLIDWPRWLAPHVQLSLFITGGDYTRRLLQETRRLLLSRPRRDSLQLLALIPLPCVCVPEVERRPSVSIITELRRSIGRRGQNLTLCSSAACVLAAE